MLVGATCGVRSCAKRGRERAKSPFRVMLKKDKIVQRVPSRVVSLDDVSQRMSQLSARSPLLIAQPLYKSEEKRTMRSKKGQ
jgi:hypothetical protein